MASIATGLEYEDHAKHSTGSKMRSYTADQSGGTDSGDAREAWLDGYGESLSIRDGYTFDTLLGDLRAGRMVHIDVWHASCGSAAGICKSGSGAYGHTMAVLPDYTSSGWLVADPWCSPAKWGRVPESQLRAGAEEWGRRVYGASVLEADYPTGGDGTIGPPRDVLALRIVARIVKRLMDRAYPGREETEPAPPTPPDWGDTGGGRPILYTRTRAIAPEGTDMGPAFQPTGAAIGVATVTSSDANLIATTDGAYIPVSAGYVRNVSALVVLTDGKYSGEDAYLVSAGGGDSALLLASLAEFVPADPDTDPDPDGEYQRGRSEMWAEWAEGLGVPDQP